MKYQILKKTDTTISSINQEMKPVLNAKFISERQQTLQTKCSNFEFIQQFIGIDPALNNNKSIVVSV